MAGFPILGPSVNQPAPTPPTLPLPIIPTRLIRTESDEVQPYTTPAQIRAVLRGINLDRFRGSDGSFSEWDAELLADIIPETSQEVYRAMRTPMDWCRHIWFSEGSGGDTLPLPYKYIYDVNLCYMRVLPSLPFYGFQRMRNINGYEFLRSGSNQSPPAIAPEPISSPPMIVPPNPITATYVSSLIFTGIEDADLFVDVRKRCLQIPPRVLVAGVGLPVANFNFITGTANIETHYRLGFPPNAYMDGSPLQYDNTTHIVSEPKPGTGTDGVPAILIDWSSGMPRGFTMKVARLVANKILRQKWRGTSDGMSSISVDGASESYGGAPFGGDLDRESDKILSELAGQYGLSMVI
jgi:hypothetical protein